MLLLFLSFIIGAFSFSYHGSSYQSEPRSTKQSQLWKEITKDTTSGTWYGVAMAEMFAEPMNTTFDEYADDFPKQFIIPMERKKLIHTVGHVAKAKFVVTNAMNFTGLFKSGADSCFIRFSTATEQLKTVKHGAITAGIGLKCLRDKVSSSNIFAMWALDGQDDFNFFGHDLTNHVPALNMDWATLPLKALVRSFEKASSWTSMIGLSDTARWDQYGKNSTYINFPYRVVYHPVKKIHDSYPKDPSSYPNAFKSLAVGKLYDVYAQVAPLQSNDKLIKIGEIHLTSKPTTSQFSDRHMFCQHTRMEDDLALKPHWYKAARKDQAEQTKTGGRRYRYGDLPW